MSLPLRRHHAELHNSHWHTHTARGVVQSPARAGPRRRRSTTLGAAGRSATSYGPRGTLTSYGAAGRRAKLYGGALSQAGGCRRLGKAVGTAGRRATSYGPAGRSRRTAPPHAESRRTAWRDAQPCCTAPRRHGVLSRAGGVPEARQGCGDCRMPSRAVRHGGALSRAGGVPEVRQARGGTAVRHRGIRRRRTPTHAVRYRGTPSRGVRHGGGLGRGGECRRLGMAVGTDGRRAALYGTAGR